MGCDIHTLAEIKVTDYSRPEGETYPHTKWTAITEPVFPYEYFRKDEPIRVGNQPYTNVPYQGRNYDLFAILADVRNGYGFAGTPTGDALEPIDQPRGVPADASKKWKRYVKSWGSDLHSTSYFTLAELKAALPLFNQHQRKTGVITVEEYERLKREGGTPTSWSGGISGPGIITISPDAYEAGDRAEGDPTEYVFDAGLDTSGWYYQSAYKTHIQYVWEQSAWQSTQHFVEEVIPRLEANANRIGSIGFAERRQIVEEHGRFIDPRPVDEDSIRLVFGFDN